MKMVNLNIDGLVKNQKMRFLSVQQFEIINTYNIFIFLIHEDKIFICATI